MNRLEEFLEMCKILTEKNKISGHLGFIKKISNSK